MSPRLTGRAMVAGVVGSPVAHSLSPLIHGAWIAELGLDAAYVPFDLAGGDFRRFAEGLRGGAVRGLNVTVPFKGEALALADMADETAHAAGAANVLLFHADGAIEARNFDGAGMVGAIRAAAPAWRPEAGPVVVLGAGGAAAGALAALETAGAVALRVVNRTVARAEALAGRFGARAYGWEALAEALEGAGTVINATTRGLNAADPLTLAWPAAPGGGVALDMVYKPLRTAFLDGAEAAGWIAADGLSMLIGQAVPSFAAFYGRPPPAEADVRRLCLQALGAAAA